MKHLSIYFLKKPRNKYSNISKYLKNNTLEQLPGIGESIAEKIEEYISLIQPSGVIYIAFDGVAPVAKLDQQRDRRYKSWYQAEITKHIYKSNKLDNNIENIYFNRDNHECYD